MPKSISATIDTFMDHDDTKADATALVRLDENFRGFKDAMEKRLGIIESNQKHLDDCIDALKVSVGDIVRALTVFTDPMRWLKANWLPIAIIGGAFTIMGGGSVGAVLKLMSKWFE